MPRVVELKLEPKSVSKSNIDVKRMRVETRREERDGVETRAERCD